MPPQTPWHEVDADTALAEIEYLAVDLRRGPIEGYDAFGIEIDPVWEIRRTLQILRSIHHRTKGNQ